jgi:hypothetical protein
VESERQPHADDGQRDGDFPNWVSPIGKVLKKDLRAGLA